MRFSHIQLPRWAEVSDERPVVGPLLIWAGGVALPIIAGIYGLTCIVTGQALLLTPYVAVSLYGIDAAILGLALVAFSILLHFSCFWDGVGDSTPARARGKLLCIMVIGICAYALCFRMLPHLV